MYALYATTNGRDKNQRKEKMSVDKDKFHSELNEQQSLVKSFLGMDVRRVFFCFHSVHLFLSQYY